MGLRENLEIIYELQSVTGKILKRQGFRVSRFQRPCRFCLWICCSLDEFAGMKIEGKGWMNIAREKSVENCQLHLSRVE
jgi:hypothetical protein